MTAADASKFFGRRVRIVGKHPHAGKAGVFVDIRRTVFGERPVVRLDGGDVCFVMDPKEWQPVPVGECETCRGAMTHTRTRGYRCPHCE